MCVVSMIGDYYGERFPQQYPFVVPPNQINESAITRAEFEALRKDVLEMKDLLKRAKIYDEEHGEPDCEMEQKVELLKKVAELVGVDLEEIFGNG